MACKTVGDLIAFLQGVDPATPLMVGLGAYVSDDCEVVGFDVIPPGKAINGGLGAIFFETPAVDGTGDDE